MNWILTSLIMFGGSVCLYLIVRKSSLLKFPTQFNNLAMFLVPLIIYGVLGITNGLDYYISLQNFIIIFFTAVLFSYLANVASLKSIELAPNPGYSLVISKSYVVFTTILSVLFLDGELSIKKAIAILVIIMFSGLVTIDPNKTKVAKSKLWLAYTIYAFFGWGFLSLIIKYLSIHGLKTLVILTYLYIFVSLLVIVEMYAKKIKLKVEKTSMSYFIGIGLFSTIFNYFNFYSVSIAPNVGYVNAINASSISVVTIFSIMLFKDEFSWRKLIGVFGVTLGLLLLLI